MEWKPIKDYPEKGNGKDRVLLYKDNPCDTQEYSQHTIVPGDMVRLLREATHYIILKAPLITKGDK